MVVPEVDDLERRAVVVDRGAEAGHDVADVGVVAARRAVAEDRDRLAGEHQLRELVDGEIGALPRAVHGEEPQRDEPDPVQVRVDVPEQLAADLGAGVRADGQHVIVFGPRHARVHAVDAARRAEHELADAARARQLQQVLRAADVDLLVAHRVGNRRPHARGRRQVHDDVDVVRQRLQQRGVADVAFDQPPGGAVAMTGDVGELERPVVERIEVVDHRDAAADRGAANPPGGCR